MVVVAGKALVLAIKPQIEPIHIAICGATGTWGGENGERCKMLVKQTGRKSIKQIILFCLMNYSIKNTGATEFEVNLKFKRPGVLYFFYLLYLKLVVFHYITSA